MIFSSILTSTEYSFLKADPLQLLSHKQIQFIMDTQAPSHCATSGRSKYPARAETKIHPDRVSFNKSGTFHFAVFAAKNRCLSTQC